MKIRSLLWLVAFLAATNVYGQVAFPTTPRVYDEIEPWGYQVVGTNWNTSSYLPFIYKNVWFRLMPPNGVTYNATTKTWSFSDPTKKYPVILFQYGVGEAGTDNNNQLKHGGQRHMNAVKNGEFPGFLLYPQTENPGAIGPDLSAELLNKLASVLPVDLNRIYCHGLSNGAKAVWNFATAYPKMVAAIAPMSGVVTDAYSPALIYTPIRLSQGGLDKNPNPSFSTSIKNQYDQAGGQLEYFLFPNNGHDTWNDMYNRSDFFSWFLSQKKNKIFARYKKNEFCPDEAVSATLGLTPGFDGYEWRKDGNLIAGATGNSITVSQFGSYTARFRRGSVWTDWSDPIVVKIKPTTQTPPIAVTGLRSTVLPAPDGSTSVPLELPEGYANYRWFRNGTQISTDRTITATTGTYTAIVSEFGGCSTNASVPFLVVATGGTNAPDPATGLSGTALSKTQIKLNWSENPNSQFNETAFEVYRGFASAGPFVLITKTNPNVTTFTDSGLNPDIEYFYLVRAVNNNTSSANSSTISVRTQVDSSAPTVPTNLRITGTSESSITLAWNASTDDVGVVDYEVYRDGVKSVISKTNSVTVYNLQKETIYRFTVKARDFADNLSPASAQVVGAADFSGLTYKYYEGDWNAVPNFNNLIPVASGISANVDISVRKKEDNFGFLWEGYIYIPVAGNYTFETYSDDGSKLYIGGYGDQYLVVNNDGLHGVQYREGTKNFPTPGAYRIAIAYMEKTGGQQCDVFWKNTASGVGSRQKIPNTAFDKGVQIPAIVPVKPSNTTATATAYNSIRLNWQDNSSDEVAFQIYRGTGTGALSPVGMATPNTTTYTDNGLSPSTAYVYQVIALGSYGQTEQPSTPISPLGNIRYGIGGTENNSGQGYIMYSVANVRTRFSSNRPDANNSDNLIAVRYNTNTNRWQYDNNSSFVNFNPVDTDVLLASVNFTTDVMTSLKGTNSVVNGIQAGFVDGDLTFIPNRWNNANNANEYTVTGTWFQRVSASSARAVTMPAPSVPVAPTLSAGTVTSTSIALNWVDNSNNELRFVLYRSATTNNNFVPIKTFEASNAANGSYVDEEVFPNVRYYYRLEVENAGGKSSSAVINVLTGNNAPDITEQSDVIMRYDAVMLLDVIASDPDQEQLVLSASGLPSFVTLADYGDGTGLLRIEPQAADQGHYVIRINVADQHSGTDFTEFNLDINDNYQPTLSGIADVVVAEGASATLNLTATDQNGTSTLTWEVLGLPEFATFVSQPNGTATFSFAPYYTDGGSYPIDVVLKDGQGGELNRSFSIQVNEVNPNVEVLVNFSAGSNAPAPWNNVKTLNTANLVKKDGANSGMGLAFQTTSWKAFTDGATTGNNSGIYPDIVLKEYYYFGIFGAPNTVSFNVTGLNPSRTYDFSFMGSSIWPNVANNGTTNYAIGGQTVSLAVQGNTSQLATISSVTPNASGVVTVTMTKGASTSAGYLNALEIKSVVDANSAPAPARKFKAELSATGTGKLTWIDAPFNETGYQIYRSSTVDGEYTLLTSLPANSSAYEDASVSQQNEYYYKVRSVNANGFGEAGPVGIFVPDVAPRITVTGRTDLGIGVVNNISVSLSDPPLNQVSLTVNNLPSFGTVSRSGNTWNLAFTPQLSDKGSYTLNLVGSDNAGNVVNQDLTLTVTEAMAFELRMNFGLTPSANSTWNNTAKATPVAGDTFNNLRNTEGATTSVGLQLQTNFGGYFAQGATTGNNSGIVPDDVLREYYWFGYFSAPSQVSMKLTGLSQYNKYTFKFVGSSVFADNGVVNNGSTVYTIAGKSASVNVQANTTEAAVIESVRANQNGEVTITLTKATGTPIGYINAMMIEAYPLDLTELNPTDLAAYGQDNTVVLEWKDNAFDEVGYQIYRADAEEGPWGLVGTVGANQTTYTDASPEKLRYYKVRGVFPGRSSNDTNIASAGPVAFKIYINVNGVAQFDAPVPWNNLTKVPVDFDVFTGIRNGAGNPTGMALNFLKNMEGHNDWGPTTGNNSGIYPDNVLKSFYWKNALVEPAKVRLENVDLAFGYNLSFFGSIVSQYTVSTNFSVGNKTVTNAQNNNLNTPSVIRGVTADEDGGILFTINEGPGSPWAIWNALVIEAYPSGSAKRETANARGVGEKTFPNSYQVRYGEADPKVSVYPNPSAGDINVRLEDISRGSVGMSIVDFYGREVYSDVYSSDVLDDDRKIELQKLNLAPGVYIIQVHFSDGRTLRERFIVVN